MVNNIEQIKKSFNFVDSSDSESDVYYCSCGQFFTCKKEEHNETVDKENEPISKEDVDYLYSEDTLDEFSQMIKNIQTSIKEELKCPHCQKNFLTIDNQRALIPTNTFFTSSYDIRENDDEFMLIFSKVRLNSIKGNELFFDEQEKHLKLLKKEKRLLFKDYTAGEVEFDLNEIMSICDDFFRQDVNIIYGVHQLQLFIGSLAKNVADVNNTNIIEELLSKARNRFDSIGLELIRKIVAIFFGIIKYTNLSTVALTKGTAFLYDLMRECNIPSSQIMIDSKATSPVKIFNFLIQNYVKKLNEDVNEDNKEAHEFIFKSNKKVFSTEDFVEVQDLKEEQKMNIKFFENLDYKTKVAKNSGKFQVMDFSNDVEASKFIYNKISTFNQYKQIIKYFKFFNKQQIIYLMQNYDIQLLSVLVDFVYFRQGIDMKELDRLVVIIKDFVRIRSLEARPTTNENNIFMDYNYITSFDFSFYDDCLMMIEVLEFDRKRHFNKIKTYDELLKYHDNLVKYFNIITDNEKNDKFKSFVDRFLSLESRIDYDGPLEIKLIKTPAQLIAEGAQMKHSASSYCKVVIDGVYVIGQIFDKSEDLPDGEQRRYTIGFNYNNRDGIEFDQVKGVCDSQGSDRFKNLVMNWLMAKNIPFKPIRDLKIRN